MDGTPTTSDDSLVQVLRDMGVPLDTAKTTAEKAIRTLPRNLMSEGMQTAVVSELVHIWQGQRIRREGMLRADILDWSLFLPLAEAGLVNSRRWRGFDVVRLTPSGEEAARLLEDALLESVDLRSVPYHTVLAAFLKAMDKAELDGGFEPWQASALDICSELGIHAGWRTESRSDAVFVETISTLYWAHSAVGDALGWLKQRHLASTVRYYVSTRGGTIRTLRYVVSQSLDRRVISLEPPRTIDDLIRAVHDTCTRVCAQLTGVDYIKRAMKEPSAADATERKSVLNMISESLGLTSEEQRALLSTTLPGHERFVPHDSAAFADTLEKFKGHQLRLWEEEVSRALSVGYGSESIPSGMLQHTDIVPKREDMQESEFQPRRLQAMLTTGEDAHNEFKSSLLWDYKLREFNKVLGWGVARALAGFMNAEGGTLLIGVDNDGNVLGLGPDYRKLKNRDGFRLRLLGLVRDHLGKVAETEVTVQFQCVDAKDVCIVKAKASEKPVYLRDGEQEEFPVRVCGKTETLGMKDAHEYIEQRRFRRLPSEMA